MSGQAVVDNLDFARHGTVLRGELAIAELERLQEFLHSNQGSLAYVLSGKTSAKGESLLECSIDGTLVLQCQRCLEALEFPLHFVSTLKVVKGLTQFDDVGDEEETVDSIPASAAMNVQALIEEEILLNLPISPLHAPSACRERDEVKSVKDERTNPFGALAALKGKL